jgi:hypothetical protein
MALTIRTLIANGLLDELAKVFSTPADADWLLWAIGYPPSAKPTFQGTGTPLGFWTTVCTEIDHGTVVGGFEPLLAAASGKLPGNRLFAPFAGLRRPHNQLLLDEIARVAGDPVTAALLLAAIGFPNAVLPPFKAMPNSLAFWLVVFEQIENGRIQGGFGDLVAQASRQFPGNKVLGGLAGDGRPTPPPPAVAQAIVDGHDVFVSYSSRDRDTAERLARALRAAELSVWFDEWSLPAGGPFARHIQEALASTRAVVVCYGTGGYGPWQQAEVEAVLDPTFQGDCLLIPVMLPGVSPHELPPFLRRLKGVRVSATVSGLTDRKVVERLIEAIRTNSGGSQ